MKTKTKFNDQTAFLALAVASVATIGIAATTMLNLAVAQPAPTGTLREAAVAPRQNLTTGTVVVLPTASPQRANF